MQPHEILELLYQQESTTYANWNMFIKRNTKHNNVMPFNFDTSVKIYLEFGLYRDHLATDKRLLERGRKRLLEAFTYGMFM